MKPSARKRINDALRKADLAISCLGSKDDLLRATVEEVVRQAYEDGEREGRLKIALLDGFRQ